MDMRTVPALFEIFSHMTIVNRFAFAVKRLPYLPALVASVLVICFFIHAPSCKHIRKGFLALRLAFYGSTC